MPKVYVLHGTYGEWSTYDSVILGIYWNKEDAEKNLSFLINRPRPIQIKVDVPDEGVRLKFLGEAYITEFFIGDLP